MKSAFTAATKSFNSLTAENFVDMKKKFISAVKFLAVNVVSKITETMAKQRHLKKLS